MQEIKTFVNIPKPLNNKINAYSKNVLKGRHKAVFLAELLQIGMDAIESQTFNFAEYLVNNIESVNQNNVKDIMEKLIDNQDFEDMLKISVEAVLKGEN